MGCATAKEKLESQMMVLKIQRAEITKEREEKLKIYEEMTGERLNRKPIPDYYIVDQKTETSSNHYNNNSRKNSSKRNSVRSSNKRKSSKSKYSDSNINIEKRKSIKRKYSSKKSERIKEES